jgi:hypothetical protein
MRTPTLPALAAAAALALLPAAVAGAAPNRNAELKTVGQTATWTSAVQAGAAYGNLAGGAPANRIPHCSPAFACDYTLVKVGELGDASFSITGAGVGGQDTLKDIDLHVYASDAAGTTGELLVESTSNAASESVELIRLEPGYYLAEVDWYLGVGNYAGTAALAPPSPPEEEI